MNARVVLLWLLMAVPALAQGFAGLGTSSEGFSTPRPGYRLDFPRDHGAHPDFRIEWWYLTANLQGANGKSYGVQWTLFRTALAPAAGTGWSSPQVWMGHAAATSAERHLVAERLARDGIGQAGVTQSPFTAWIDDWTMTSVAAPGEDDLAALALHAAGSDFSYDLKLTAAGPLVLHGDKGFSVKSQQGQASYYYSQPFYRAAGTLRLPDGEVAVTGQAWLDREWSSQPLAPDQTGWDWFSLHLDGGAKLMGFRLRDAGPGFTSATWIAADGTAEPIAPGALSLTPLESGTVAGRRLPLRWRIELPSKGLDVTTQPLNPQSWMATRFPYWEGPITFTGTAAGRGYLEMTGYD
ncbi:MAG: lipocalin-like domain-containing protein [Hyphomicrobiales bacterium]